MNFEQLTLPETRPNVVVIIPCYNYGRFLRQCVESVLSNTSLDVRVIIVDDASTDETPSVCAELSSKEPRIKIVRHNQNQGHIATYNDGLDLADAEYVHLISADDQLTPFALDRAVAIMARHNDVGMVYGRAVHFSLSEHPPLRIPCQPFYSIVCGTDWIEARCRDGRNPIYSPEVTLRGVISHAAGSYESRLPNLADLDMWLRVAARANVAIIENADQALYRTHPQSMHIAQFRRGLIPNLQERVDLYDIFFRKHNHLLLDTENLRNLARTRVARDALRWAALAFDEGGANSDNLIDVSAFVESLTAEARRLPEWSKVQQRLAEESRLPLSRQVFGRFNARVRRWLEWQLKTRDLGHRGLKILYSGRLP